MKMNAKPPACPQAEEIRNFCVGRLPSASQDAVAVHLEECPSCEAIAAEYDRQADSLIAGLRMPESRGESQSDPQYWNAADRVKQFSPSVESDDRIPADHTDLVQVRDYHLLKKLGEGGMGTVYKAVHTRLDRIFALKVLPPDRMRDEQAVARFQREMRAVGAFDHPAIVRATDAGELDGTHFLVMEYVDGLDLSTLAERIGPLPIPDACELVRQAAEGLQHVHERDMVHRDVKPSNLMLTPQGSVKILDLGLALLHGSSESLFELTTVGQFMGTLDYMAPEQADDSHEVDIRADVYSLGAALYKLLTNRAPFAGPKFNSPLKKFKGLALLPVPSICELRPEVPQELAETIDRMLAKAPDDRFATPEDVARALEPFTEGCDPVSLLKRAEEADRGTQAATNGSLLNRLPFAPSTDQSSASAEPSSAVSPPRRGGRVLRRIAAGLLGALVFAATGFLIHIQTDTGVVVIESPESDVEVLVKKSGKTVDHWELEQGPNRTSLRTGTYEIVLLTGSDGLQIQDGRFTLTRGGEQVVTIERKPESSKTASVAQPEVAPTYGGKTFDEWANILQTERKREALIEPLQAISVLGTGERAEEAARLALEVGKENPNTSVEVAAIVGLQKLYSSATVELFATALKAPDGQGREIVLHVLWNALHASKQKSEDASRRRVPITAEEKERLLPAVLAASHDEKPAIRERALQVAIEMAFEGPDVSNRLREKVTERLRDALRDPELRVVNVAAYRLAVIEPDAPELPSALFRIMTFEDPPPGGWWERKVSAAWLLTTVGQNAEKVLPQMIDFLTKQDSENDDWDTAGRVLDVLKTFGPKAAPAMPQVVRVLRLPVARAKLYTLAPRWELEQGFGKALPVILPTRHVTQAAIEVLGAIGPAANQPNVIEILEEYQTKSAEESVRTAAADALMKIRQEASSTDRADRSQQQGPEPAPMGKKTEVGTPQAGAERPVPPIYGGKTFDQWAKVLQAERKSEAVIEAILALKALADNDRAGETARLILRKAQNYGDPWAWGGTADGLGYVRQAVIHALQSLDAPSAVAVLIEELGTPGRGRLYALTALSRNAVDLRLGSTSEIRNYIAGQVISVANARPAIPALLEASRDEDPKVRFLALSTAEGIAPDDPRVHGRLREALKDPSVSVTRGAAHVLAKVDPKTKGLDAALFRVIRHKGDELHVQQKAAAADLLASIAPDFEGLVPAIIGMISQTGDSYARGQALLALKKVGRNGTAAIPTLVEVLEDPASRSIRHSRVLWAGTPPPDENKSIAQLAIEALRAIGPEANQPKIIELLESAKQQTEDVHLQRAAAEALEAILNPATDAAARNQD